MKGRSIHKPNEYKTHHAKVSKYLHCQVYHHYKFKYTNRNEYIPESAFDRIDDAIRCNFKEIEQTLLPKREKKTD